MNEPFFDNWELDKDRWFAFGDVTATNGSAFLNAETDGPVVMQPLYFNDAYRSTSFGYQHTIKLNGRLRLSLSQAWEQTKVLPAFIEFDYNGSRVTLTSGPDFALRFDGSASVTGDTFLLRALFTNLKTFTIDQPTMRVIVLTQDGSTVIADSQWLTSSWYLSNVWFPTVSYGYQYSYMPNYQLLNGSAQFGPQTGNMNLSDSSAFAANGPTAPKTATPTSTILYSCGNWHRVSLAAESGATIYYTIDDLGSSSTPYSSKSTFTYDNTPFYVYGPCHLKVGASVQGKLESDVLDQWIGLTNPVAPPEISPLPVSQINGAVEVRIAHVDPNAIIRYTLDGSTPTSNSALYSGSITLHSAAVVKAIAFVGAGTSDVRTNEYAFNSITMVDYGWTSFVNPTWCGLHTVDTNTLTNWKTNSGNATADSSGLHVNDPSYLGVALDLHVRDGAISFKASGPFQYRFPGSSWYFTWTSDGHIGFCSDLDKSQLKPFPTSNSYAWVRINTWRPSDHVGLYMVVGDVSGNITGSCNSIDCAVPVFCGSPNATTFTISHFQYVNAYHHDMQLASAVLNNITRFPFFSTSLAFPIQQSAVPTLTPSSGDLSSSDITITGAAGAALYSGPTNTAGVIPGHLSVDSAPIYVYASAVEPGKLPSALVTGQYYCKRDPLWFSDNPSFMSNWNVHSSFSNWIMQLSDGRLAIGPTDQEKFYGVASTTNLGYGYLMLDDGRFQRPWSTFELNWSGTDFDDGRNLWMQTAFTIPYVSCVYASFGFNLPDSVSQLWFANNKMTEGVTSIDSCFDPVMPPLKYGMLQRSNWSWTSQTHKLFNVVSRESMTYFVRIGRRGTTAVRFQIVDNLSGNAAYDSDWLPVASANPIRPRIVFRERQMFGVGGQSSTTARPIDGYYGMTDQQLNNLFSSGTLNSITAPTLSNKTNGSMNGTVKYDLTADSNSTVLINPNGMIPTHTPTGLVTVSNQISLSGSATSTGDLVAPTDVVAISIRQAHNSFSASDTYIVNKPIELRSLPTAVSALRDPSELISLFTVRKGEIEIAPDTTTFFAQAYYLTFDDGSKFRFTFDSRPVQKTLGAGPHWVRLSSVNNSIETGLSNKFSFNVPQDGSLSVSVPTQFTAGQPVQFTAAGAGSIGAWSYHWSFSDGQELDGSSVTPTFERPGRYRYRVTADDSAENTLVEMGTFVVPYIAQMATGMTKNKETRVS